MSQVTTLVDCGSITAYKVPVGGQWIEAASAFDVKNPATQTVFATVPDCSAADARIAHDAAVSAFASWRRETAFRRSSLLKAWFSEIMANQERLARVLSSEMGKPISEARGEIAYAAAYVESFAEEATRVFGEAFPVPHAGKRAFAQREPVGPVYAITPWNFPAAMITRKVAPALAAGCTVIVKPAAQSPLTAIVLAELWEKVGGPTGTFQVVTTTDASGVSQVMFDSPAIRKLTFTGSTATGRKLYQQAAGTIKKVSLELGGHAPFLIFEDADIDLAVKEVMACKFRNAGQTCVCTNRIYVHETILEAFAAKLQQAVDALKVGDPALEDTQIGPLVDGAALDKVARHVEDAVAKGAKILTGGRTLDGLFYAPTVLTDVMPGMDLMVEETFGPVAPLLTFKTEAEAIQAANDTPYGLAAYFYTNDLSRAIRVSEALDYGIVGVNDGATATAPAPFGGIKDSGIGREGGPWGIAEFLEVKYVSIAFKS
jgi:succinate-semialdehyde dehydrogenase/glutarate-semialdehyde dehydrogenase